MVIPDTLQNTVCLLHITVLIYYGFLNIWESVSFSMWSKLNALHIYMNWPCKSIDQNCLCLSNFKKNVLHWFRCINSFSYHHLKWSHKREAYNSFLYFYIYIWMNELFNVNIYFMLWLTNYYLEYIIFKFKVNIYLILKIYIYILNK